MNAEGTIRNLAMLRLAVGVGAWLMPGFAGRLFGIDTTANPQAPYLARLFGVRDIALALGALQSSGEARRQWLQLGVVCDAADVGAAALGKRGGYLSPVTAVLAGGVAAGATALGVSALQAPDA
jgi:hypothetical protein